MESRQVNEARILAEYTRRTPGSAALFEKAKRVTPGGVMAGIKFFRPHPVFMRRAAGSRIWDVDGNEYIDYLMSYGALMLGHGQEAVRKASESVFHEIGTTVTGTPTEMEVEFGGIIRDLYNESGLVRFTNSGLEATLLAVRLARAHTGKRCVAKFEGHYHGANDQLLVSYMPPVASAGKSESPTPVSDSLDVDDSRLSDSLVLPFNDWESTEKLVRSNSKRLAGVIMEPFEEGVIPGDRKFMRNLRSLTSDLGIPLIYDEVKTGFRVRVGGASEYYSITPDITCLGKIIGGGLPIGAVVGGDEIMEPLDPAGDRASSVFHSGTFNGNPLVMSTGRATVEVLMRDGNFDKVVATTETLKKGISSALSGQQVRSCVIGEGAMFSPFISVDTVRNYRDAEKSDVRFRRNLDLALISRGVYLKPTNRYCLSLAHSKEDIKQTLESFVEALGVACSLLPS